ncbi:MAG: hypothetical protein ABMA64_36395 [Myxococcota bacterium]
MQLIGWALACSDPHEPVVYVSERDGAPAAWFTTPDGPSRPLLPGRVSFPADADPRGELALLVVTDDGPRGHREQLWLAPLREGEEPRPLGPPAQLVRNPAWAPDGSFVVFESDLNSFRDLYRVDRGGAGLTRLTDAPHGSFEPAVSPDGTRIAFGTSRDGNAEIWWMGVDGSEPRRLTDHPTDDVRPRWLPDGRLAWISSRSGRPRVTVGTLDGAAAPVRGRDGSIDVDYAVSPTTGAVAIVVQRGQELAIELDGETYDGPGPDEHPAWSPDGRALWFTSSRLGTPQLWRVRPGRAPVGLALEPTAAWLPRPLAP